MNSPSRDQVIAYAAQLGVPPLVAANYHAHCSATNWRMKDGSEMRSWQACFRIWVERTQGRPGCEIVLHDKPKPKRPEKTSHTDYDQDQWIQRTSIIMEGRERGASNDLISKVLAKHGLSW